MNIWANQYRNNVLAVIFDKTWKILIGKNAIGKDNRTFPKWWKNKSESDIEALYRELYEEIGLGETSFELVYVNPKTFDKAFTQEQIDWKIQNKGEYYIWKSEKIFFLRFMGWEIDLSIEKELSEIKWVEIDELGGYIGLDLLAVIDMAFLKELIRK